MTQPWRQPAILALSEAMASSYVALVGKPLAPAIAQPAATPDGARALYEAPFALLCHDGAPDPLFTYANRTAQRLWRTDWHGLIGMASRLSAEPEERDERAQMLSQAATTGYITGYSGIRVAANGDRFEIQEATVWTVTTADGEVLGQAARLPTWRPLSGQH